MNQGQSLLSTGSQTRVDNDTITRWAVTPARGEAGGVAQTGRWRVGGSLQKPQQPCAAQRVSIRRVAAGGAGGARSLCGRLFMFILGVMESH